MLIQPGARRIGCGLYGTSDRKPFRTGICDKFSQSQWLL